MADALPLCPVIAPLTTHGSAYARTHARVARGMSSLVITRTRRSRSSILTPTCSATRARRRLRRHSAAARCACCGCTTTAWPTQVPPRSRVRSRSPRLSCLHLEIIRSARQAPRRSRAPRAPRRRCACSICAAPSRRRTYTARTHAAHALHCLLMHNAFWFHMRCRCPRRRGRPPPRA